MRASMHGSLCCVQCFKLHGLCCCGTGGKALVSCAPQWLEGQCLRPHCQCCPVTCGHRCTGNCSLEARVVRTTSPAIAALSGEPGLQVPPPLFPWSHLLLSVPVHPPLDAQVCGILHHPRMFGRSTSVELWMSYWLHNEGKKLCHSACCCCHKTPSLNGRMARSPTVRKCGLGGIVGKYYLSDICIYWCVCMYIHKEKQFFPPKEQYQ